jgi:hypothetical protein
VGVKQHLAGTKLSCKVVGQEVSGTYSFNDRLFVTDGLIHSRKARVNVGTPRINLKREPILDDCLGGSRLREKVVTPLKMTLCTPFRAGAESERNDE